MDTIAAEHFDLTPATTQHLQESLEKIRLKLRKRLAPTSDIHVTVSLENRDSFSAHFSLRMPGENLASHETARDFNQAVNQARDRLIRQITDRQYNRGRKRG